MKEYVNRKAEILENKDIDGGLSNNRRRMTLPKNDTDSLAELDRKEATIAFDTTLGQMVIDDGSGFAPVSNPGDITAVVAGTGLTGGGSSGSVTLNIDVGTSANQIVQLDGTGKLPAVDGSQLTNLPSSGAGYTKYSFSYADFIAGGHGGDPNRELPIVTIPVFTVIDDVQVYISEAFNDLGGDGVTMYVTTGTGGGFLIDDSGIDGGTFFKRISQATIDASGRRVFDSGIDLTVILNAASGGAHTLSEITSGIIDIYVRTTPLE